MLRYFKSLLIVWIIFFHQTYSSCFIAKENGKIVKEIGVCNGRYSPFSTFKIPLALMAFDLGILHSLDSPMVKFTPEIDKKYITFYDPKNPKHLQWKKDQRPVTWIQNSVIWYSRYLTHKMGQETIKQYLKKFDYGNQNFQGNPGKKDGLMCAWVDSSLQISHREQLNFLEKVFKGTLPVSQSAHENTIKLIKMGTVFDGWELYGKTGGVPAFHRLLGCIRKKDRIIFFMQYVRRPKNSVVTKNQETIEIAKRNLKSLI